MSKMIPIACQGAGVLELSQLTDLQGNLKELHRDDYEKLRHQILELGFSEPVSVWPNEDHYLILNGHQRVKTVRRMVEEEGYEAPLLPVNYVGAADLDQAKRKVLSLTSQFGKMTEQGLREFLENTSITAEELSASYRFPEVDVPSFVEQYFTAPDANDIATAVASSSSEGENLVGSHSSGVRMVQLFFNEETHAKFLAELDALAKVYGVDNVTDAVAKAVEEAYANHQT